MLFVYDWMIFAVGLALLIDAQVGDPPQLYRQIPHPVVLIGRFIKAFEQRAIRPTMDAADLLVRGFFAVVILLLLSLGIGALIQWLCLQLPFGWLLIGVLMSALVAQKSLSDHVDAVASGLVQGVDQGRQAVARIVGRDPEELDEHAVSRAAVESLAENFSDGVVAPIFWGLLLGLPGMLAYKAINTADSMIGHKSGQYLYFGRVAARLDDAVNWLPARISGIFIMLAAGAMPGADFNRSLQMVARDAGKHRSPNAGWPEAAMAGALGFRLAGPRAYDGKMNQEPWIGEGDHALSADSIDQAVSLFWRACAVHGLLILGLIVIVNW